MPSQAPAYTPKSPALATLVERGYFEHASDIAAIDAAFERGMVTFYNGYDPTAPSLHAGHLVTIMALRVLQRHGHKPLCLLGGGTAMVGDPSGKSEMRKLLTPETISQNALLLRKQFARFLHFDSGATNDALLLNNADWLLGLRYIEFLRDIGRHFTVNRMVAVKTYRDRLDAEIPLSFLEFNYQLLQSYDFLHLYKAHNCTVQTGGADQWGNMVACVELIRLITHGERPEGKEPEGDEPRAGGAYCLTYPLLTTADGKKMGKTERGAVWLDPELVSPFDYYQYWIKRHDRDVPRLLRLFTELPMDEIDGLTKVEGAAMREATRRLAFEATKLLHGDEAARQAEKASQQAFGGSVDWSAVPEIKIATPEIKLVDLLVHERVQAFKSKRETRKRIEAKAVRINDDLCTDPNRLLVADYTDPRGLRLKVGKKRFRVCLVRPEAAP